MVKTAEELRNTRLRLGLTQREAAAVINRTRRCWQSWETGQRTVDQSCIELFLIKTGLKVNLTVTSGAMTSALTDLVVAPEVTVRLVDRDTRDAVSCYKMGDSWRVSASWGPLLDSPSGSFAFVKAAAKLILRKRSKQRGRRRLVLDTTVYEDFNPKVNPFP